MWRSKEILSQNIAQSTSFIAKCDIQACCLLTISHTAAIRSHISVPVSYHTKQTDNKNLPLILIIMSWSNNMETFCLLRSCMLYYVPLAPRTSRFTVVSHHPNVFPPSIRVCLCQTLWWYFLQFFTNGFQIPRYGDYGWDLEWINFSWLWLNFQGHRRSLCFKINFVYAILPVVLCWWLSN